MTVAFTLSLSLIPYVLVVAGVAFFAYFNIQHLLHYGATTKISFIVTFAYLAGTIFILFFTWQALRGVDWRQPINITPPTIDGMTYQPL